MFALRKCLLSAGLVVLLAGSASAARPYVGQADVHGSRIVFTAEDDLWSCDRQGGDVRRLTRFAGTEYFPHISPDGTRIAFTGEYDGNRDVYVIPMGGGEPQRLTWHPAADEVVGWTPDGRVIMRSRRTDPHGDWHVYFVSPDGGDPVEAPLGAASRLAIDPAGGQWAFNVTERERATWKRYRGGTAADIWVGDPKRADFRQITDFAGPDELPMWWNGTIYFLSDQGGTGNLWRIAPDGSGRTQVTHFDTWDARWPAMGDDGTIVFTLGGDLQLCDAATGRVTAVAVDLPSDRVLTRNRYRASSRDLQGFDLSPDGERLLVEVRGELFSVPVKEGVTLPVTRGTGARERAAAFSHDGKQVLYWCDATGEDALQAKDAWGRGEASTLRKPGKGPWPFAPVPSPDGKWLAWTDSEFRLVVMKAEGGGEREADRGTRGNIRQLTWSPDGRWLAYVKDLATEYPSIFIYDTQDQVARQVTGNFTADHSPAWDPDGRYLWFVSNRATNPVLGQIDLQNVEVKNELLYALLLRPDVKSPLLQDAGLPPAADDAKKDDKKSDPKDEKKDEKKDADEAAPVVIDFAGLGDRVVEIPVDRGNHFGLAATTSHVFYLTMPLQGMAEGPDFFEDAPPSAVLMTWSLEDRESATFVAGVGAYELEAKAGKVAIMTQPGQISVVAAAAPPGEAMAKGKVKLDDAVVELDPRAEWTQIYWEAWRQMRDFYWDPAMAGLDWDAIGKQYATLLDRVASRADLGDLIGQVYGEANTSHSYVFGGDAGVQVPRVATGLLGADLVRDGDGYRVVRILRGDAADCVRSPLAEPGVAVAEGQVVLAVNRQPVKDAPNLHALLAGLAGKPVLLAVADDKGGKNCRDVLVTPLGDEGQLRYADWVRRNREYVAEKTGGKIGYIHVPDMGTAGMVAFNKWFYPQLDKEGMIVDVRWNGGGFVSQMLVERLRRPVLAFDRMRNGESMTYPYRTLNGPFVVLTNENAGSDGDIFPQAIQLEKLAPVIGKRSWGGVIGINAIRPLQDGGLVTQPVAAWWDGMKGWGVENHGVDPDIVVDNLPQDLARGVDAQLDRGIAEVLKLHAAEPPVKPAYTPVPQRTREAYKERDAK